MSSFNFKGSFTIKINRYEAFGSITIQNIPAKRNYYFQKISSDMNPRDLWKTLKAVLPNKNNSHNVPSEMNANSFNEFFTTIGENVTKSIPSVMPVNQSNPDQQGFKTPLKNVNFLQISTRRAQCTRKS